ncbi:MAG TPA: hypothetical protein VKY65_04745 [Alphaproteobacteria bacterium]|nr:hypothetical protein [Alphaproteobacteria bacterium]
MIPLANGLRSPRRRVEIEETPCTLNAAWRRCASWGVPDSHPGRIDTPAIISRPRNAAPAIEARALLTYVGDLEL